MRAIESITWRRVLNSHAEFTTEFVVKTDDGAHGVGASPQGETISIYEDRQAPIDPEDIVERLRRDGWFDRPILQEELDGHLDQMSDSFGRNNCYALSLAFFNACGCPWSAEGSGITNGAMTAPFICCNILNGGWHAYTNPVLSDFPEYLLVARSNDIREVMQDHDQIQRAVAERLSALPKRTVGGNPVCHFPSADNRQCIEFLLSVRDGLGMADRFDLMVDASAGDLWNGQGYRLALTDDSLLSSDELLDYWLSIVRDYPLRFLEDPFGERDAATWSRLTTSQETCLVIGDNFYSSNAARLAKGAADRCTHGLIVKPNQAGTVTAVRSTVETAKKLGQIPITSHRSISTESPFEATLTCMHGVKYIKVGPLLTDYSSVIRMNEIIRLTEE